MLTDLKYVDVLCNSNLMNKNVLLMRERAVVVDAVRLAWEVSIGVPVAGTMWEPMDVDSS